MRYLGEPNAVYLDGVGHDGDSRNAGSSDGLRVAGGMAEMKMLDRIEQSDRLRIERRSKDRPSPCDKKSSLHRHEPIEALFLLISE